jgi:hypothetical protein
VRHLSFTGNSKGWNMKFVTMALAAALAAGSTVAFAQSNAGTAGGATNGTSQTTGGDMSTKGGQPNPKRSGMAPSTTTGADRGMTNPSATAPGSNMSPPSEGKK